jgi:hypothetical protein
VCGYGPTVFNLPGRGLQQHPLFVAALMDGEAMFIRFGMFQGNVFPANPAEFSGRSRGFKQVHTDLLFWKMYLQVT